MREKINKAWLPSQPCWHGSQNRTRSTLKQHLAFSVAYTQMKTFQPTGCKGRGWVKGLKMLTLGLGVSSAALWGVRQRRRWHIAFGHKAPWSGRAIHSLSVTCSIPMTSLKWKVVLFQDTVHFNDIQHWKSFRRVWGQSLNASLNLQAHKIFSYTYKSLEKYPSLNPDIHS